MTLGTVLSIIDLMGLQRVPLYMLPVDVHWQYATFALSSSSRYGRVCLLVC